MGQLLADIGKIKVKLAPGLLENLYSLKFVNYLMRTRPKDRDPAAFVQRLAKSLPQEEAKMTISYYDAIVERSKAEGRTEGDRQRVVSVVMKMVEKGLPLTLIASCTDLPLREVQEMIQENGAILPWISKSSA